MIWFSWMLVLIFGRPGTSPSDIHAYTLDYHLQSWKMTIPLPWFVRWLTTNKPSNAGIEFVLFFIPWGKMGSVVKLLRLFVICQLDGFDCYQILPSKMYSIIPCALKTTDICDQWISLLSSFKNLLFCWFLTFNLCLDLNSMQSGSSLITFLKTKINFMKILNFLLKSF